MSKRRVAIVGIVSALIATNAWSADPVLDAAPVRMRTQKARGNVEPFKRLKWDFRHVLDSSSNNPYVAAGEGNAKPKHRTGFQDLSHAIKNVFVEAARARKNETRQ